MVTEVKAIRHSPSKGEGKKLQVFYKGEEGDPKQVRSIIRIFSNAESTENQIEKIKSEIPKGGVYETYRII